MSISGTITSLLLYCIFISSSFTLSSFNNSTSFTSSSSISGNSKSSSDIKEEVSSDEMKLSSSKSGISISSSFIFSIFSCCVSCTCSETGEAPKHELRSKSSTKSIESNSSSVKLSFSYTSLISSSCSSVYICSTT